MALRAPNYFEPQEFKRMRTRARRYSKNKKYGKLIKQLKESCDASRFIGISPQNLVEPAELLPVIMVRQKFPMGRLRTYIDPRIIKVSGRRRVLDGCGNIGLYNNNVWVPVNTYVYRPTYVRFLHVLKDGTRKEEIWREKLEKASTKQSPLSILIHEIEHLKGTLIADHARERLLRLLQMANYAMQTGNQEVFVYALSRMPYVLVKEERGYVLYHGGEFAQDSVPEVGPQALFGDLFFTPSGAKGLPGVKGLQVKCGGKLHKIALSKRMKKVLSKKPH